MNRFQASLYVLVGASCYGTLSTITKLGFMQGFSPAEISSSQVMFGCLILWLCTFPVIGEMKKHTFKTILFVILAGTVWGFTEVFYTVTIKKVPASLAVILLFQFTWMSQVVHMVQKRTWLTLHQWIAVGTILVGTYWASGVHLSDFSQLDLIGIILGLCSAISYTASIFISGSIGVHIHPLVRSSLMVTGQMLFVFLVFPPTFLFTSALANGLWIWAGLLGFLGIVVTTITYNKGIPHIGTGLAGILGSIELPMVLLLATLILQEKVSSTQWIGALFILVGIIIAEKRGDRSSSEKAVIVQHKVDS